MVTVTTEALHFSSLSPFTCWFPQ